MKMIKKVLAAVLAMAMVIGMMAMSTFAAEKDMTVTVKWECEVPEGATVHAWIWGDAGTLNTVTEWAGDEMTKNADGTYTITFKIDEQDELINFIPSYTTDGTTHTQTVDVKGISTATGKAVITVKNEKDEEGKKYLATAEAVSDTATGDSSVMVYVVAAVVAVAAAVTVVCKRRSVEA